MSWAPHIPWDASRRAGTTRISSIKNGPPLSRLKHGVSTGKRRAFRGERSPGWTGRVGRNWRNSGPSMLASNKESLFKGVRLSGTVGAWFLLERDSALRYTEGSEKLY